MLHLLGSFSMVFQIPSSYSAVAIFFLKKRSLETSTLFHIPLFGYIAHKYLYILITPYLHPVHTYQASFAFNKLLSENNVDDHSGSGSEVYVPLNWEKHTVS